MTIWRIIGVILSLTMVEEKKPIAQEPKPIGHSQAVAHIKKLGGKVEFDERGKALAKVSLRATPVTDADLVHLQGLTGLQSLWLSGSHVTDAGLPHLKELTGLEMLGLAKNQVSEAALNDLRKTLPGLGVSWQ